MRKSPFYLLFLFIFSLNAFGQTNKELAEQLVEIGDEILAVTVAFDQAREQYLAALDADPENIRANYMTGQMFLESVDKARALQYFQKAYALDPEYSFELLFKIGLSYHYGLEFDNAINYYQQYLYKVSQQPNYKGEHFVPQNVVERKVYECEVGKELVASPRRVAIKNLGREINSEYDDYAPVLNASEDLIIFTSRRIDGNLSFDVHTDNLPFEDIYYSIKSGDSWLEALNIGEAINTPSHNSNLALSQDGTRLYIYNDVNNGDIFESRLGTDGNWSSGVRLEEPINTEFSENGVSVNADRSLMFFSSTRSGGFGGSDIYMSRSNNAGHWRKPENLGPVINTEFQEEGPFIGYDGKTLYFTSRGGRGMGGFDIFKSEYDSLTESWGIPENLGYPINTPDDDVHFSPTTDGFRAYYATTRDDGYGNTDIYEITFIDDKEEIEKTVEPDPEPETETETEPEPEPELVLQPVTLLVNVRDADTDQSLESKVSLTEISTGLILVPSGSNGNFAFTINAKTQKEYQLTVEKDRFAYYNNTISIPGMGPEVKAIERTIKLKKLEVGFSKVLRNIYFDTDKTELKDPSLEELNKLERMMTQNAGMNIGIVGHTDEIGSEKYNLELSKKRALAVKTFLVSKGIDPRRIKTGGLGSMFPIASNDDEEEGRELNRRVEMVVLK
jgi:outer membrane protein OmpA-like peptidoglycan-associated protein/tetratricopeptide (TPR) repeat protein